MNIGLSLDEDTPMELPKKESVTTIQETNAEPSTSKTSKQQNFMLDIEDSSASSKPNKKISKPRVGIAIDTEAINELYTYGGEQGKKKTVEENEIEDFESGILELATQCLAAMKREKPTDPIVYEDETMNPKKSFGQKFGDLEDVEQLIKEPIEEDDENYFRPNFNVPQTMRGIKNFSLGLSIKQDNQKNFNLQLEDDDNIQEENDYGDEDEEDESPLRDEQGHADE